MATALDREVSYPFVIRAAQEYPWAILPEKLSEITEFLEIKSRGGMIPEEQLAQFGRRSEFENDYYVENGVAVFPIYGTLVHRAGGLARMSGLSGMDRMGRVFDEIMSDTSINSVILEIDSPGGQVRGLPEFADKIRTARGEKHVVAFVNTMAASGAFWLASQASEVVSSPSGVVGSVGVYMMHVNQGRKLEEAGIDVTYISAGKYKVDGNPTEPLSHSARAFLQERVDKTYAQFVEALADARSTSRKDVEENYGQGRVIDADEALKAGAIDSIETFESLMGRLQRMGQNSAKGSGLTMVGGDGKVYYDATVGSVNPVHFPDWRPVVTAGYEPSTTDTTIGSAALVFRPSVGGSITGGGDMAEKHQDNAADAGANELLEAQRELAAALARAEAAENANNELASRVDSLEASARRKEFTDIVMGRGGSADGSTPWHGDIESHVDMLMFLSKNDSEGKHVQAYITLQQQTAAALRESSLFSEVGHDHERSVAASTRDEIEQKIAAITAGNPGIDYADALARVARENPTLYRRYVAETQVK